MNSTLNHNVVSNDKRDGLKINVYGAISSQAAEKSVEGSTTRNSNLSVKRTVAVRFIKEEISTSASQAAIVA